MVLSTVSYLAGVDAYHDRSVADQVQVNQQAVQSTNNTSDLKQKYPGCALSGTCNFSVATILCYGWPKDECTFAHVHFANGQLPAAPAYIRISTHPCCQLHSEPL
jgi:hypothetical protein